MTRCDSRADFGACPCCGYSVAGKPFGACPYRSYSAYPCHAYIDGRAADYFIGCVCGEDDDPIVNHLPICIQTMVAVESAIIE